MNILVVDDQRAMREFSKSIIGAMGHEVFTASSGNEAIEVIRESKTDLVLMDVEMPGLSGFDTAKEIRSISQYWFPIIFLSGMTDSAFFVKGIKSGGDAYLYKPIIPEVLQAMVKAMERIVLTQEALHHAKVRMERLAHRDDLTGLVNRRGFDNAIELEFNKSKLDHSPLTVMMIDVDHFKAFNDNYGHQAGDDCLKQVAEILRTSLVREYDIIARYGGEEFSAILPNTRACDSKQVAKRIVENFNKAKIKHEFAPTAPFLTVSIGGATLDDHHTSYDLIEAADKNLYRAKSSGRNRFYFDTETEQA